ncbi:hypothetical protein [Nitrobacter sp.]|uniref:hypothetical protein n=1 Tax=Nitrobacter sp. TaxID=29420 RepID=UPI0029CABCF7|nr:hypothetical protein [Nitrobacter sp.]
MVQAFRLFIRAVKHGLHLLLLWGALIGLLGQEAAFATVPPTAPTMSASMAMTGMTEDCMKMMQKQQPEGKPCKGLTLDCIAAMGCIVPVVLLNAPVPLAITPQLFTAQTFWPMTRILVGSDLAPEPPPPTLLG